MKETTFSNNFMDKLTEVIPALYKLKISGSEKQRSGVPDYLTSLLGIFVAIEFKIERNNKISLTPKQTKQINNIRASGGQAFIIAYAEKRAEILVNYQGILPIKFEKYISLDWDMTFHDYHGVIEFIIKIVEI